MSALESKAWNDLKTLDSKISKILIISDTHQQSYDSIDIEIKKQIINSDLVVHCGDITSEHVIKGIKENACLLYTSDAADE